MSKRYRRLDEGCGQGALAAGSYGRVYAAVDTQTMATVAVKRQELPSDTACRELCFYKALSQERHDHVMQLIDHFVASSDCKVRYLYLVFELMDTTLWQMWTSRRRVLPFDLVARFVRHLVSGVAHLHRLGVVHSDLSMANLLISHSGSEPSGRNGLEPSVLRIADIGSAASAADLVLPPSGVITAEYVRAPEVILGCESLNEAVDLWAVGVVAMALTTGSLVFWRPAEFEGKVDGLFRPDSPLPAAQPSKRLALSQGDLGARAQDMSSHAKGVNTLANQVAVLGPITAQVWPGCDELPRFWDLRQVVSISPIRVSLVELLADKRLARRALAADEAGSAFIGSLLKWHPPSRLRAKDLQEHEYLRRPAQAPLVAQALANSLSAGRLREIVLRSLTTASPVTLEALCQDDGGAPPSPKRAKLAPTPQVEPSVCCAASVVTAGGTNVSGRRRLRVKTIDPQYPAQSSLVPVASAPFLGAGEKATCLADGGLEPSGQGRPNRLPEAAPSQGGGEQCANVESLLCARAGNCGQKACVAAKNSRIRHGTTRQYCTRGRSVGSKFCVFCRCECCSGPRCGFHAGQCRWCTRCGKQFVNASKTQYHNRHGTHSVGANWPKELQMAAWYSYVTNLGLTSDCAAWFEFVRRFLKWRGMTSVRMVTHAGDWMLVSLVACVAWPQVVDEALTLLSGLEPRTATATQWRDYLLRMLSFSHGKPWNDVHRCSSPSRHNASFGLTWFCETLGIANEPSGRVLTPGDGGEQSGVLLGPSQTGAGSSQARLQKCLGFLQTTSSLWPTSTKDVTPASSQVRAFAKRVSMFVGELLGEQSVCARGMLCRRLLSLLELEYGHDVWDGFSMGDLRKWVPDVNGYCAPLRKLSAKEARLLFDMSPLNVSTQAGMWGMVEDKHMQNVGFCPRVALNAVTATMGSTDRIVAPASSQASAPGGPVVLPEPREWMASVGELSDA